MCFGAYFIPQSFKNILIIASVKTLKIFSWLINIFIWLYKKLLHKPIYWFGIFLWRHIVVNIYHAYLFLSRQVVKLIQRHNNKLAILLNKKIITPIIILMMILAVVTNNIAAKETTREDFGRQSILFTLTQDEFGGHEIIEDKQKPQISTDTNNKETMGLAVDDMAVTNNLEENNLTITQGTALVQQNIIAADQARTRIEVEDYTVQPGDTASGIAKSYGLSESSILWANNLSRNTIIRPGQILKIPPQDGVVYKIAQGDTIKKIAETYQADELSILEANADLNPNALAVGVEIFIPDGVKPAPKIIVPSQPSASVAIRNILSPSTPTPGSATDLEIENKLLWPAKSRRINQYYSWRHRGLDIDGDTGDPAYAPESGKVERAGWSNGYGYNVIINHGNGIKTLQGHFSKILVEAGDTVERGDVIALIGSTGWSTGPHIHFEVIVNGVKVNPFTYTK